jgi:hypothetical protein
MTYGRTYHETVLTAFRLFQSISFILQIQLLDLRSRPGGPSQKLQAGLDARVIIKASDVDDLSQFFPPMMLHQLSKHHFQRDAVKRIFMLLVAHSHIIFPKSGLDQAKACGYRSITYL